MSFAEGLNNIPILRPNSSSSGADVSSLSEREMKVLKNELKNLRQTIVESLSVNRLEEIVPILSLIAFYKCDPTYKYPSFDFMSMFLWCYMTYGMFDKLINCLHILAMYGETLLCPEPERTPNWRRISRVERDFYENVGCFEEAMKILNRFGYKKVTDDFLVMAENFRPENCFVILELTVELMAAKQELEAYVNKEHPHPQYLRHHISTCCDTVEKQAAVAEGFRLVADGFPQDTTVKINGHADADTHPSFTSDFESMKCDICSREDAEWICVVCDNKMVCTDCDLKWHQHPKRQNHKRQPLKSRQSKYINDISSDPSPAGNFVRTSSTSEIVGGSSIPVKTTASKSPVWDENMTGAVNILPSSAVIEPLTSRSPSASRRSGVNVLPKSVTEINEDLSYRSLFGVNDVHSLSGQNSHHVTPPDVVRRSTSRQLNSLTSDFQSTLESLQSVMKEVDSRMVGEGPTSSSGFDDLSLSPAVNMQLNKQPVLSKSPTRSGTSTNFSHSASTAVTKPESRQSYVVQNADEKKSVIDSDPELAMLLGQTKYPPNMCTTSSPIPPSVEHMKLDVSKQAGGNGTPQSTAGEFVDSKASVLRNKTSNTMDKTETKGSVQKPINLPRTGVQSTLAVENGLSVHSAHNNVLTGPSTSNNLTPSGHHKSPSALDRQKSQTVMKQRITDSPGVVFSRVGDDTALGVVERTSDGSEPYQSKFTDIHDEIYYQKKEVRERELRQQDVASVRRDEDERVQQSRPAAAYNSRLSEIRPQISEPQPVAVRRQEPQAALSSQHTVSSSLPQMKSKALPLIKQPQSFPVRLALIQKEKQLEESKAFARSSVRALKYAEQQGFTDEEIKVLQDISAVGKLDLLAVLASWARMAALVVDKARNQLQFGSECRPDVLARQSLLECSNPVRKLEDFNINEAVDVFKTKWNDKVESVLGRCRASNLAVPSRDQVVDALSSCNGDEEETVACLVRSSFLHNIYAGCDHSVDDRTCQQKNAQFYQELSTLLNDESQPRDRRLRMILCEAKLKGWQRADYVVALLTSEPRLLDGIQLSDVVEAVNAVQSFADCRRYLQKDCEICYSTFPTSEVLNPPGCQCNVCRDCLQHHFEVVIRERYVRNMVCPVCGQPDIDNSPQADTHFQLLSIMLKDLVPDDVFELFQTKLRDWNLMMDPLFRWCAHASCHCGFVIDAGMVGQAKIICPNCDHAMCQLCKKVWEDQHEGISCEAFQAWKEANDPETQAMGLARHLEENGIECPQCKCRYSLAKGGCMHFTCYQCRHEFCSGCLEAFKRGKKCKKLKSCAKAGLHCHHPRNCLFYLRDHDIRQLQKLLQDHSVQYDTMRPPPAAAVSEDSGHCSVMEQKQTQNGFKDEPCGKPVPDDFAGLCEIHYKEYLVGLVNQHGIDPAEVMTTEELTVLIERAEKKVPQRRRDDSSTQYTRRLLDVVRKELPLLARSRSLVLPALQSRGAQVQGARSRGASQSPPPDQDAPDGPYTRTVIWWRRPDGSEQKTQ